MPQERSKPTYFQQALSRSSDCCPIHAATRPRVLLQLLPGGVSANRAVAPSTPRQQLILLSGAQVAHSHLPLSESESYIFAAYALPILLYKCDDASLPLRPTRSRTSPQTVAAALLLSASPRQGGRGVDGCAEKHVLHRSTARAVCVPTLVAAEKLVVVS